MTIDLRNVCFAYPDAPDKQILNIPSWSVSAQAHVFVHGPSGGGKSTLLNILSGMLLPRTGQVNVLGKQLDKMTNHQRDQFRAKHIGYVFQQFNLIPYLDAIDNVQMASHFSKGNKRESVRRDIKLLLDELNIPSSDWSKPIDKLSIGQQQRVAIARALINKPQLLIADEPTSSLDQDNRDIFMSLLMSMLAVHKTTLLFVSHDLSLSPYFSQVETLSDINHAGRTD